MTLALEIAIEEALASLERGMVAGAELTLRDALWKYQRQAGPVTTSTARGSSPEEDGGPGNNAAPAAGSHKAGMTLGERIKHVGGRETEAGLVEFGSAMAVSALVQHVIRDLAANEEKAAAALRSILGNQDNYLTEADEQMARAATTGEQP